MPATRSYFIDKKKNLKSNFYRYGGQSGLVTTIAAGTSSAGHVYALRNPSASKLLYIAAIRLQFIPTVAFGAAQAVSLAAYKLTGYSAAHTGATAITPAKRVTSEADASVATARIADTGALTAGTHTIAGQPLFRAGAHGTLPSFDALWKPEDDHVEVLAQNEGILIRNEILMGASGVGIIVVGIDGWER